MSNFRQITEINSFRKDYRPDYIGLLTFRRIYILLKKLCDMKSKDMTTEDIAKKQYLLPREESN